MAQPLQHQHIIPCPCGPEGCECSAPGAAHEPVEAEAELARTLAVLCRAEAMQDLADLDRDLLP